MKLLLGLKVMIMNKLRELINELCPNGVEYMKVGDVTYYEQPAKYIVKSTNYSDDFNTPVLTAGQSFILGYTNETDGIFEATKQEPVIIFDDFTGAFKWVDFPFKVKSSAMKLITSNKDVVLLRYLYHIMGVIGLTSTEHKRLWLSKYSEIKIPVPPLPAQKEIVKILDKMTDYVAELKAELKARKMQYEHYRDGLLAFDGSVSNGKLQELIKELCPDGAEYKKLKNITILNGLKQVSAEKLSKLNTFSGKIKLLPSSSNYDWYCEEAKELNEYLYEDEVITLGRARNANIKYHNGKFIASQNHIVRSKNKKELNTKYLYYFLLSNAQNFYTTQSSYPLFNKNDFNNCEMPVPPLPVQEEIVRILDKFNLICNDISIGLPAEIEARQKQYEYYRDKLLSFQKLENEEC